MIRAISAGRALPFSPDEKSAEPHVRDSCTVAAGGNFHASDAARPSRAVGPVVLEVPPAVRLK
jgi:hypothetical protein